MVEISKKDYQLFMDLLDFIAYHGSVESDFMEVYGYEFDGNDYVKVEEE